MINTHIILHTSEYGACQLSISSIRNGEITTLALPKGKNPPAKHRDFWSPVVSMRLPGNQWKLQERNRNSPAPLANHNIFAQIKQKRQNVSLSDHQSCWYIPYLWTKPGQLFLIVMLCYAKRQLSIALYGQYVMSNMKSVS